MNVGVYICHCGTNIAGVIDVELLKEYAKTLPNVVKADTYKFMCSDLGQDLIRYDIKDGKVNRVVVAACSPRMHETTFRRACEEAGLNSFLFEQANIREHSSWVTMRDPDGAFDIAKDHVRLAVAKVSELEPLEVLKVPVEQSCLVVGGGIAGMNASLDLAKAGYNVYLIEREPTIGGHMAQLDKTFPTMDCSSCILTPRMADVAKQGKIHLYAYSEVESVDGYVGNFEVKVKKKPHYIDQEACTACGLCSQECPIECANEFELGMKKRKAAYIPYPQATPGKYTIDKEHCVQCGVCAEVCPVGAVRYDDKPKFVDLKVGTIIIATGWDPFDPTKLGQYGFGKYPNVITGLQMERLLSSFGPTAGKVKRPSDLKEPHSIAFLQCVGSRDFSPRGNKYCSRVCCMYATKQARQYKEKHPEASVYVFYIDLRAFGKGYEEFYEAAGKDYGIKFMRGRIAEVYQDDNMNIVVRSEDTLLQRLIEIPVDILVLSIGLQCRSDAQEVSHKFNIQRTADGFFMEAHPKLRPVDTLTDGVFIAGAAQGPKDIPDTVAQAKGAAASAIALMGSGEVEIEPYYSVIDHDLCSKCQSCIELCPFNAITYDKFENVVDINKATCKGCGTCVAACPCGAIKQNHFKNKQLLAMINAAIIPT